MRIRTSMIVLAVFGALPAASTAAVPGGGALGLRVVATLDGCTPNAVQSARNATFGAQMTTVRGTSTMEVRFDLEQRNPGELRFHAVSAPGLGKWHLSVAGIGIFRYSETVASLPAPASFRVRASYRWLNAHRRIIRRTHRTTPSCVLPDERPNLTVGAITVRRGTDRASDFYDVVVRNDGLGDAGAFDVVLTVGGQPLAPLSVPALASNTRQLLSFTGPRCVPGAPVGVTIDPHGRIDETTKADDGKTVVC